MYLSRVMVRNFSDTFHRRELAELLSEGSEVEKPRVVLTFGLQLLNRQVQILELPL
jgi:hypothetical protein